MFVRESGFIPLFFGGNVENEINIKEKTGLSRH